MGDAPCLTDYTFKDRLPLEVKEEMALNIKNPEVERLAAEVAAMMSETKTEAIRRALQERRQRLSFKVAQKDPRRKLISLLESEVWPVIPKQFKGKRLSHREEDRLLGYGREGI